MKETKFKQTEIGKIPEDWEVKTFSDVAKFRYGKMPKKADRVNKGFPIFSGYKIVGYHREYMFEDTKLIVVARGVGGTGDVKLSPPKSYITNLSIIVDLNENIADKHFLKYYFHKGLRYLDSGSAQSQITINDLNLVTLAIPPLREQRAIASILSSLDDKIELNQRMNKTLEAIAQAIFKHWFIDFEFPNEEGKPYKSSGGEMVYNEELGKEIPKGWKVGELGDIIKITSGKRPEEKADEEDDVFNIPLVGSSKIMGFVKKPLFREPVIIIGRVGTHGIVQRFNIPTFPSDNTLVMTSPFYEYVYQILKRIDYESLNIGSTQPLITQTSIKNYRLIIPNENILMLFEQKSSILFERIYQNKKESKSLAKIRDALLPKLMSGEVRVKVDDDIYGGER